MPPQAHISPASKRSLFPQRTTLIIIILAIFAASLGILKYSLKPYQPVDFDECSHLRGSIIQESYPPVCVTSDGKRFVQNIDDLTTPTPNPTAAPDARSYTLIDPVNDWTIRRLSSYKLATPPDWLAALEGSTLDLSYTSRASSPTQTTNTYQLQINLVDTDQTLDQYVSQQENTGRNIGGSDFKWLSSTTTLDGQPAFRITTSIPGFLIYSRSPDKDQMIEMVFLEDFAVNNLLANQILNSFSFIPANCPVSCSPDFVSDACSSQTYSVTSLDNCSCPQETACYQDNGTATDSAQLEKETDQPQL